MPRTAIRAGLLAGLLWTTLAGAAEAQEEIRTERHGVRVEVLNDELNSPWGLAFLPDGQMLVTEKGGRLLRLDTEGGRVAAIEGLPELGQRGQGGLMGITLHPAFPDEPWVYLAYAAPGREGWGTEVLRGRLSGNRLEDVQVLFRALPKSGGGRHFGGRVLFDRDGLLYLSLGDRGKRPSAQDRDDHRGSLIRLTADGGVPPTNPFVDEAGVRPEIFTLGNRNMQGMALHPDTGAVWTHEHGPQGGDEVNLMRAGVNYGWPTITYGRNYGTGTRIGAESAAGLEQPVHKWVPSIAPSGMAFYAGDAFSGWRGDLFVGSLKFGQLVRLRLDGERVTGEERIDGFGRVRDVVAGPDGYLYLLTERGGGELLRLTPTE